MNIQNPQLNLQALLATLGAQGVELWPQGDQLRCEASEELLTPSLLATLKARKDEILTFLTQFVETHPLAEGQQAPWLEQQVAPQSTTYNVAFALRIHSEIDVDALQLALQRLVNRHPALRTTFIMQAGAPRQQIHAYQPISFQRVDACGWSAQRLAQAVLTTHYQVFDLEAGPLLRTTLFTNAADGSVLLCSLHHLISDGWSSWILLDELAQLYQAAQSGESAALPLLAASYLDYMAWQREFLQQEGERLWAYWRQQLNGTLPVLNLPTDYTRPPVRNHQGDSYPVVIDNALTQALRELARTRQTTLYTLLLAAWQVLLYRYTGQADILVGSLLSGRSQPEFAEIVGYFTAHVVMRADLADNPPFQVFLQQVRHTVFGALEHQDYPFLRLVERLQQKRDPRVPPIYQASFALQQSQRTTVLTQLQTASQPNAALLDWGGMKVSPYPVRQNEGQVDLFLELFEGSDTLVGDLRYDTDLFEATTVARIASHFQTLLQGILTNPQQPIAALPLLAEAERQQLLVAWNDTAPKGENHLGVDYPLDQCVHQLFEEQVIRTPDAVAAHFADQSLTYRELNARANRLAHYLQALGVGQDVVVGLLAPRTLDFLTALLAIFKAGGVYLPLEPRNPTARYVQTLQQSRCPLVLCADTLAAALQGALTAETAVSSSGQPTLLSLEQSLAQTGSTENLSSGPRPCDLAYVLFTSGSTGLPKGAMVEQRGMVNHLFAKINDLGLSATDRMAQTASQAFDISVFQFMAVLILGGTVYIYPDEISLNPERLFEQVNTDQITVWEMVPSFMRALLDSLQQEQHAQDKALPALRWLIPTGEALPPALVNQWLTLYPKIPLLNAYGPTECSDDVTHYSIYQPLSPDVVNTSIGRPILNMRAYVLDNTMQPTPIGIPGELWIGGVGVGRGYLHDAERTANAFIPDPFGDDPTARLYKTGDLARWRPDGNLEYLGRIDYQVKIHGFRIELGEIENTLLVQDGVREAVVLAREDNPGDKRLVAYFVGNANSNTLRQHLAQRLPDYMIPAAFVTLEAMPLTANGKLDRRALPAPDYADVQAEFIAPRNALEAQLAAIWTEVLGVDRVGIYDNFFTLGGHSLLVIQIIGHIRVALQIDLALNVLYRTQTIADLGKWIDQHAPMHSLAIMSPWVESVVEQVAL